MSNALLHRFRFLLLLAGVMVLATACPPQPTQAATDSWDFTVKVGYSQEMVTKYGGEAALQGRITAQLGQIADRYTGFSKSFTIRPISFYTYASAYDQYSLPHPEADLHVIYVENPLVGGGWAGVFQVIMHSWYEPNVAGIVEGNAFAPHATDGLAHEFGHFRGAIDIYAINVDPAKNPVNHTGFQAKDTLGETIMDYAYDHQVIDAYSRCIIEKSADTVNDEVPVVAQTLPGTYQVNVKTAAGANVAGASVKLYPVEWYSNSVTASPVVTGTTASNGLYQLSSNPFRTPESVTKPWGTVAGNFLVEVRKGSQVSYSWLPISAAGLSACTHPGEDFVLSLTLG